MKKAGIREARQNLSVLLEDVKKGHEVVITERGKPIAVLMAFRKASASKPFPDFTAFRRRMPVLDPPLSESISEDREDRI